MLFGIIASLLAITGIVLGVVRHERVLIISCVIALILIAAVWAFFWFNPY